jgi:hypothetical protein
MRLLLLANLPALLLAQSSRNFDNLNYLFRERAGMGGRITQTAKQIPLPDNGIDGFSTPVQDHSR